MIGAENAVNAKLPRNLQIQRHCTPLSESSAPRRLSVGSDKVSILDDDGGIEGLQT